jgi:integrating conjugative element protein (TIGR03755 family)
MKKIFISFMIILFCITSAYAKDIIKGSIVTGDKKGFYYQIGGGDVTPLPYTPDKSDIDLEVHGHAGLGYNCGIFDPEFSIVNSLNSLKSSFEHMETQVVANAKAAILELPAYKLAQYMPTLYNLIQNGVANGQFDFGVATKSCQQMVSEVAAGKNPYNNWLQASLGDQWKYNMSLAGTQAARAGLLGAKQIDINQVKSDIAKDNGKSGVQWVQGNSKGGDDLYAGGEGQPIIYLTSDTVIAGYNVLIDSKRRYDDKSAPTRTDVNARIVDTFSDPTKAAQWAVKVIGEQEITTYDGGKKTSIPGRGLLNDVQDITTDINKKLSDLVDGSVKIDLQHLKEVSPPKVMLNNTVIQMLRKQSNPLMQAIYVNKIAEEVAVAKVIDKAKLVMQFLEVGSQAPPIYANHAAQNGLHDTENRLRQFISDLRDNPKDNEEFVGGTITKLMSNINAQEVSSAAIRPSINTPPQMEYGAVQKNQK